MFFEQAALRSVEICFFLFPKEFDIIHMRKGHWPSDQERRARYREALTTIFQTPRARDAWATIRGYVYQAELTIARWLDIRQREELELERGEDIDRVSEVVTADGEVQERILEQVKHLQSVTVTLHSTQVLTALANFLAHRTDNPTISLQLRFTTNAGRGQEEASPFRAGTRGLDVWEAIRQGTLQELPLGVALAGIRSLLKRDHAPDHFPEAIWHRFQTFVSEASDEELSRFIRACEWSTGTTEARDLRPLLQQRLQNEYHMVDNRQAEELYARLFLAVFRLLSQSGRKVLTVEKREQEFAMPTLSASDHATLELLRDMHRQLEERVSKLEQRVDTQGRQQEERFSALGKQITQLAREQGVDVAIAYTTVTPILDIPPLCEHASLRTETVQNLRGKIEASVWTAVYGNASTGKTQLAILLVRSLGTRCTWIRLESTLSLQQNSLRLDAACSALLDGLVPQTHSIQWYQRLADHLGRDAIIEHDDLPRLTGRDELSQRLIELACACQTRQVCLLSTSPYRLPESLRFTLGNNIVCSETISPLTTNEATEILREYGAPDLLLASSAPFNNSDMLRLAHPVNDIGLLAMWDENPLPLNMDIGIRLHLRGLQITLRRKWQREVPSALTSDFSALFEEATTDQAWALLTVLLVAHDEVPNAHRALLTIFEALPLMKLPNGRVASFTEEDHLEELIWANILSIASTEDLRDWTRAVELLTPEQRDYAFAQPPAELGCLLVTGRLWRSLSLKRWN